MNKKIVISGYGYVAYHLLPLMLNEGFDVIATSRNPDKFNGKTIRDKIIRFDLQDNGTYQNIPEKSEIIWLFPAEPLKKVIEFHDFVFPVSKIKIVMGTTSSYVAENGNIDESFPLKSDLERVKGENYLLENGTVILQTSGIYGNDRSPFDWLNRGLIRNSNKTVNLIHVEDICNTIIKIINTEIKGQRINLSDGNKYKWKDLWETGKEKKLVFSECPPELSHDEKYISNKLLKKFLGDSYNFKNLLG